MRMYEKFTGCRVLTYCLMCNHVYLLVEVTPRPAGPMTDDELLRRYRAISSPMAVKILRNELKEAREKLVAGLVNEVSFGWCGDWSAGVCGRGVPAVSRAVRAEAERWGRRMRGGRCGFDEDERAMEYAGFGECRVIRDRFHDKGKQPPQYLRGRGTRQDAGSRWSYLRRQCGDFRAQNLKPDFRDQPSIFHARLHPLWNSVLRCQAG